MTAKLKTKLKKGFLARFTFKQGCESYYTNSKGCNVIEVVYPEDDDVYELIDFCEEHRDFIENVTVLMADGNILDAKAITTASQEK